MPQRSGFLFPPHCVAWRVVLSVLVVAMLALGSGAPLSAALVAHYKLDEGSGSVVVDSANGYHGTRQGASWQSTNPPPVPSGTSSYLLFNDPEPNNGTGQYVSLPASNLFIDGSFTVASWVNVTTQVTGGGAGGIVGVYRAGAPFQHNYLLRVFSSEHTTSPNQVGFIARDKNNNTVQLFDPVAPDLNTWQHYAVTFNSTDGNTVLYRNGQNVASGTLSSFGGFSSSGQTASLGTRDGGGTEFRGMLDEVRIYNEALSATAIDELVATVTDPGNNPDPLPARPRGPISVNFAFNAATTLSSTDIAGVVPAENWNNINVITNRSFDALALEDSTGNLTGITLASSVDPGFSGLSNGIGTSTPSQAMMDGSLYFDNVDVDTGTLTLSGLDSFAGWYDLILYLEGGAGNDRDLTITINGQSITLTDRGGFSGEFIEADGTDGDYIRFRRLSGDTLTILADSSLGRAGISGLQLIASVPEPASLSLTALGIALALFLRRKR